MLKLRWHGGVEARLIITIHQYTLPKSTLYCEIVLHLTFTRRVLVHSVKEVARIVHFLEHIINHVSHVMIRNYARRSVVGVQLEIYVFFEIRSAFTIIKTTAHVGLACLLVETKWHADPKFCIGIVVAVSVRIHHCCIVFSIRKGLW